MKLKLKSATAVSLTKYPGENGTTQVLVAKATLTPPIADRLRCREGCYDEKGTPRNYDSFPSPNVRIQGADVLLGEKTVRANLIHKFKISQPKTGGDTDVSLELRLRLHFAGAEHIADWLEKVNNGEFVLAINARQEDLNFGEDETATDEDPEEEEIDTGCVACNAEIPMGLGGFHESGAKCTREDKEATLAPAAVVGGTHQRKRRGEAAVQ